MTSLVTDPLLSARRMSVVHAWWLPGLALISLIGVVLGIVDPPTSAPLGFSGQSMAIVRLLFSSAAAATLLVGPGLVVRDRWSLFRHLPLGFVPIPGIGLLGALGGLVWFTASRLDAHTASRLVLVPVLVAIMLLALRPTGPGPCAPAERTALSIAGVALVVALGRSLWAGGPDGELYAGTISRTLEVGDRSDSRISYHVVTLVANGFDPFTAPGATLFAPWSFSDRGPLSGMIAAPVVLLSGATPSPLFPDESWSPFDPQGFMVYRIVMMMLALTALLALYTLTRHVAGARVALLATAVAAGTPFFVHDVYFTWPKFCAAAQCLLAAYLVIRGKPVYAGLFVGLGFLFHPLALFSIPALLLLILLTGSGTVRHRLIGTAVGSLGLVAGVGAIAYVWKLINGPNYVQGKFLDYLTAANDQVPVTPTVWLSERAESLGNTVVPLRLPLFDADSPSINAVGGQSDTIIHFYFQYWTGVPFGLAIVFFPFLIMGLVRLGRRHPVITLAMAVVPLVVFTIYWGSFSTGLLREGMHVWVLTLVILWCIEIAPLLAAGGPGARLIQVVLILRLVEVAMMLTVPALTSEITVIPGFRLTNLVAVVMMLGGLAALGWMTVRLSGPAASGHGGQGGPVGRAALWAGLSPRPDGAGRFATVTFEGSPRGIG